MTDGRTLKTTLLYRTANALEFGTKFIAVTSVLQVLIFGRRLLEVYTL